MWAVTELTLVWSMVQTENMSAPTQTANGTTTFSHCVNVGNHLLVGAGIARTDTALRETILMSDYLVTYDLADGSPDPQSHS